MPRITAEHCHNCRYFESIADGLGTCMRFPPNMQNPNRDKDQSDFFPRVDTNDWCGEWCPPAPVSPDEMDG